MQASKKIESFIEDFWVNERYQLEYIEKEYPSLFEVKKKAYAQLESTIMYYIFVQDKKEMAARILSYMLYLEGEDYFSNLLDRLMNENEDEFAFFVPYAVRAYLLARMSQFTKVYFFEKHVKFLEKIIEELPQIYLDSMVEVSYHTYVPHFLAPDQKQENNLLLKSVLDILVSPYISSECQVKAEKMLLKYIDLFIQDYDFENLNNIILQHPYVTLDSLPNMAIENHRKIWYMLYPTAYETLSAEQRASKKRFLKKNEFYSKTLLGIESIVRTFKKEIFESSTPQSKTLDKGMGKQAALCAWYEVFYEMYHNKGDTSQHKEKLRDSIYHYLGYDGLSDFGRHILVNKEDIDMFIYFQNTFFEDYSHTESFTLSPYEAERVVWAIESYLGEKDYDLDDFENKAYGLYSKVFRGILFPEKERHHVFEEILNRYDPSVLYPWHLFSYLRSYYSFDNKIENIHIPPFLLGKHFGAALRSRQIAMFLPKIPIKYENRMIMQASKMVENQFRKINLDDFQKGFYLSTLFYRNYDMFTPSELMNMKISYQREYMHLENNQLPILLFHEHVLWIDPKIIREADKDGSEKLFAATNLDFIKKIREKRPILAPSWEKQLEMIQENPRVDINMSPDELKKAVASNKDEARVLIHYLHFRRPWEMQWLTADFSEVEKQNLSIVVEQIIGEVFEERSKHLLESQQVLGIQKQALGEAQINSPIVEEEAKEEQITLSREQKPETDNNDEATEYSSFVIEQGNDTRYRFTTNQKRGMVGGFVVVASILLGILIKKGVKKRSISRIKKDRDHSTENFQDSIQ